MAATKTKDEVQTKELAWPKIHHIVRGIGTYSNPSEGVYTVQEVDAYIQSWLDDGYKIIYVAHAGTIKSQTSGDQVEKMVYVLLRE